MTALAVLAFAGFLAWAATQWRTARREHLAQPIDHRHDHKAVPGARLVRCTCGDTQSQWRPL